MNTHYHSQYWAHALTLKSASDSVDNLSRLIADGLLLICLANPITQETLRAMIELRPQRVVCLDPAFKATTN